MSDSSSGSTGGIGFLGVLAILFIALKLTGYIDWSWWWVLAPLWGGFALVAVIILIGLCIAAAAQAVERRRNRITRVD